MKIGIITQPLLNNYGGILQNYALQQVLMKMGYEPITLDQKKSYIKRCKIYLLYMKKIIERLISRKRNSNYPFIANDKITSYINQQTKYFIDKYINHTNPMYRTSDFRTFVINNKIEILITGSDQVWRRQYNENIYRSFFDFAKGLKIKRLSYAASFGLDYWEFSKKQTYNIIKLIKLFDAVSVRERSSIDLCRNYLNCKAEHVLDPTMLLDKEDYVCLVENEKEQQSNGSLYTYILDNSEDKQLIIDKIANELNLIPFTSMPKFSCNLQNIKNNLDDCVYPSVTQWIRGFMDAKFVVCDSFHGTVFSIIFNKPFIIVGNKKRGTTRFTSLLETFGLQNRMVNNPKDICKIINTEIDWSRVNSIREGLKIKSLDFLNCNIKL